MNNENLSFYDWLATQKDRDDIVGDLAIDAQRDQDFPKTNEYEILSARLPAHCQEAFDEAWREYQGEKAA